MKNAPLPGIVACEIGTALAARTERDSPGQSASSASVRGASPGLVAVATTGARGLVVRAVKTICTTNCAWSATVRMVTALASELGVEARDGRRAFPSPTAMAEAGDGFYKEVVRAVTTATATTQVSRPGLPSPAPGSTSPRRD